MTDVDSNGRAAARRTLHVLDGSGVVTDTIEGVRHIDVSEGHLYVHDIDDRIVAVYAPGRWQRARLDL